MHFRKEFDNTLNVYITETQGIHREVRVEQIYITRQIAKNRSHPACTVSM